MYGIIMYMGETRIIMPEIITFDWDKGNLHKNRLKHNVTKQECEEVFFNEPIVIFDDPIHSFEEKRYRVLGRTDMERTLALIFTFRTNKIRIISVRDQSRKERHYFNTQA